MLAECAKDKQYRDNKIVTTITRQLKWCCIASTMHEFSTCRWAAGPSSQHLPSSPPTPHLCRSMGTQAHHLQAGLHTAGTAPSVQTVGKGHEVHQHPALQATLHVLPAAYVLSSVQHETSIQGPISNVHIAIAPSSHLMPIHLRSSITAASLSGVDRAWSVSSTLHFRMGEVDGAVPGGDLCITSYRRISLPPVLLAYR